MRVKEGIKRKKGERKKVERETRVYGERTLDRVLLCYL